MTKDRSFLASREPLGGYGWAKYQDQACGPGGQPVYPTMSESTRAEVSRAVRKGQADLASELQRMIAECLRLQGRLANVLGPIKDSADLSGVERLTLCAIVDAGAPATVPQIGRSLGHARQVIQRAARELERRGFVETRDNPSHKRASFLVATERGRAFKQGLDLAEEEVARTLVGGMDRAMIRAAYAGLHQLCCNLDAHAREQQAEARRKSFKVS